MDKQSKSEVLSAEQVDLISKKLKEIPLDIQLNGELLPIASSNPINIVIDSEGKNNKDILIKTPQTKNSVNISKKSGSKKDPSQKEVAKASLNANESKTPPQKTTSKPPPQKKETKTQQNPAPSNSNKEPQDPSKGLDDWLDSLLS